MLDEHYKFLSNIVEIFEDENYNELEVMNDFFKSANFKINKKTICLIKEFLNDDELFFVEMEKFYDKTISAEFTDQEICCKGCKFNCSDNVYRKFKNSAFFFMMLLLPQIHFMSNNDRKNFIIKFFKEFNLIDGEWRWDLDKTYARILNFNMFITDKLLSSNNDTFKNIKDLNEINDQLNTSKSIINNLVNETIAPLENYAIFFEKKLISYKTKYELEKEEQANFCIISKNREIKDFEIEKTKSEIILEKLNNYGFSELEMVSNINITSLIEHIFIETDAPYQLAYLWHLGFVKHLRNNYFISSWEKLYDKLAIISDIKPRRVKGNILGLKSEKSKDRKNYEAYKHIENIQKHYQTLLVC